MLIVSLSKDHTIMLVFIYYAMLQCDLLYAQYYVHVKHIYCFIRVYSLVSKMNVVDVLLEYIDLQSYFYFIVLALCLMLIMLKIMLA